MIKLQALKLNRVTYTCSPLTNREQVLFCFKNYEENKYIIQQTLLYAVNNKDFELVKFVTSCGHVTLFDPYIISIAFDYKDTEMMKHLISSTTLDFTEDTTSNSFSILSLFLTYTAYVNNKEILDIIFLLYQPKMSSLLFNFSLKQSINYIEIISKSCKIENSCLFYIISRIEFNFKLLEDITQKLSLNSKAYYNFILHNAHLFNEYSFFNILENLRAFKMYDEQYHALYLGLVNNTHFQHDIKKYNTLYSVVKMIKSHEEKYEKKILLNNIKNF